MSEVSNEEVEKLYLRLKKEGEKRGYFLNPDVEFTKLLIKGLLINEKRYGYWACPCRLASGSRDSDLDIICPCDYRDADLKDFGCCYCALYVTYKNLNNKEYIPIPERRGQAKDQDKKNTGEIAKNMESNKLPIWRCKVCGYLCAREGAPQKCPICGADEDRFEKFEL